jgi:hypothetical protein
VSESSTYLTLSLIAVFVFAWFKRKKLSKDYYFWIFTGLFFGVMSIGPRIHYGGHALEILPMPYVIMEKVIPGLKLSGMPVRMLLITILSMAVIASMVFAKLNYDSWKGRAILGLFVIIYALEVWPSTLPLTAATFPKYIYFMQKLPNSIILDNAAPSQPAQLMHQTKIEKRLILGYISRTPKKLETQEAPMVADIMLGRYDGLCKNYKLRYVSTPADTPLKTTFPIIYKDREAIIYDFKNSPGC